MSGMSRLSKLTEESDFDIRARRALNAADHDYRVVQKKGSSNVMHRRGSDGKEYLLAVNSVYSIDDFAKSTATSWAEEGLKLVKVSGIKYEIQEI